MIEELNEFCEMLENDRDLLKSGKIKPEPEVFDIIDNYFSELKGIITKYETNRT